MPAQPVKGNLVKVEVATAMVPAIAAHQPTAVTKAKPAVATFPVGHGLSVGMGIVFSVSSGMAQLDGLATRISALATNAATLQDVDGTTFSDWITAAGNTVLVAQTWALLGESVGYTRGANASTPLDDGRLHLSAPLSVAGPGATRTASFDLRAMTYFDAGSALAAVRDAALVAGSVLMRITHPDGATEHLYGAPSEPGVTVSFGALGTSAFTLAMKNRATIGAPLV